MTKQHRLWIALLLASLGLLFVQLWIVSPGQRYDRLPAVGRACVNTRPPNGDTPSAIPEVAQRNPSERWVVLDAEDKPCDVRHYSNLPGWKTLVVRAATVENCRFPKCTSLDMQTELGLGSHLNSVLPRHSPARRMIAYLYCIAQGAKIIYDGACALRPLQGLRHFQSEGNTSGLVYSGPPPFDPFYHFSVPRPPAHGYPTPSGQERGSRDSYVLQTLPVALVQQGLPLDCQESPRWRPRDDPLREEDFAPAFTRNFTLGPLGPSNTAFTFEAFWTMVLPFVRLSPTELLLRSYIVQTLVRIQDGYIGYFPRTAECEKLPANSSQTGTSYPSPSIKSFQDFVTAWRCPSIISKFECLRHLMDDLVKGGFLNDSSINITGAWIQDLKAIGYKPLATQTEIGSQEKEEVKVLYASPGRLHQNILSKSSGIRKAVEKELVDRMKNICPKAHYRAVSVQNPVFEDIMLIVVLNYKSLHQIIPSLELIHRRIFRHILYCGPDVEDFAALRKETGLEYVTYVQGVKGTWYQVYDCVTHAMRLNVKVQGYLFIGDDTLVNFWAIWQLPRDRIWLPQGVTSVNREVASHPWHWYWWTTPYGRLAINRAFRELEDHALSDTDEVASTFLANYRRHTRGTKSVYHRALDIFYIPQRLKEEFITISDVFSRNDVLHELAIATMHFGLDKSENLIHIHGSSLWRDDRTVAETFFNVSHAFLHPFKTKHHLSTPEGVRFFCQTYIPLVENKYAKLRGR